MTVDKLHTLRQKFIPEGLRDENVFTKSKEEYDIILNTEGTMAENAARFLLNSISQ